MYKLYDAKFSHHGVRMFEEPDVEPVGTIEHEPSMTEHIMFGDKTYVVCSIHHQGKWCTANQIQDFDGDTEYTHEMICPWCGSKQSDPWEYSSDGDDIECGTCGREFSYERDVSVTYSTKRKGDVDD